MNFRRQPFVVAYGMGVDSTAMLIVLRKLHKRPDLILFADTGSEKPETYAYLAIINAWLLRQGWPTVTVVKRVTRAGDESLEAEMLRRGTLPAISFGWHTCSDMWKQAPQRKFINNWEPAQRAWKRGLKVIKAVGYDASPRDTTRCEHARTYVANKGDDKYELWFPLQDWNITREQCVSIIKRARLPVPPKSACFFCIAMKPDEVAALSNDLLARAITMEDGAQPRLIKIKGLGRRYSWRERYGERLCQRST